MGDDFKKVSRNVAKCKHYREKEKLKMRGMEERILALEAKVRNLENEKSILEKVILVMRKVFCESNKKVFPDKLPKFTTPGGYVLGSTHQFGVDPK